MTQHVEHTDVGAYALGLLDAADRRVFEIHLTGCPSCRAELSSLAEVAVALSGMERLEYEQALPRPADSVNDFMRRRAVRQRARRRSQVLLSAAAALVLVGGGIVAGGALAPSQGQERVIDSSAEKLLSSADVHSATDSATGVHGIVGLQETGWGTKVALKLGVVKGPLVCQLIAVSKGGGERVVTGWAVPVKGYGLPDSPNPLVIQGGTETKRSDIDHFEVRTDDGRTLVTIPL